MEPFTPDEVQRLLAALAAGREPACPRCDGLLEKTDVPPRPDVAYVRDRIWLVCGACRRTAVVDRKRVE